MEQPSHSLRHQMGGTAAENAPRRAGGILIVSLIHVGIAALLVLGMKATEVAQALQDLTTTVETQKVEPKPPPPPPDTIKPPPPFIPPPQFTIQTETAPPPAIQSSATRPTPPPPPAPAAPPSNPPTPPEPIQATRTKPPYPAISQRLGEQGTTVLQVTVSVEGRVTDATVTKSSGSKRLDQAAIDYVKQRYRYKPGTIDGKPVELKVPLQIVWSLMDAQ